MYKRIGISTLIFREFTLREALERISRTKVSKIDISVILPSFCPHYDPLRTDKEDDLKLKDLLASFGFEVSTLNIVPGYFNVDPTDRVENFIKRSIDIAHLLGAHSITMPSGAKVDDREWERSAFSVKQHLLAVNQYARDNGVFLSIESPHVRTLTETIDESRRFHGILEEPTIKCTLDTSHVRRLGNVRIVDAVKLMGIDRINHVHLRDAVGQDIDFTPGKGTCDFKSLFQYMERNSYKGDYILELEYDDINEHQKLREIEFAKGYCIELLDKGRLSLGKRIQTAGVSKFIERVRRNPKAEIRRHQRLLSWLRVMKQRLQPYAPEKVYDGRWIVKMRFNKRTVVRHSTNSVSLTHKPSKIINVGIVGCGYAGWKMHAPGFQRLEDVNIVGFYDIVAEKSKACASAFRVKACACLDELIYERKPDLIAVCSREWAHYEATMKALNSGVDVFCEKLLATHYNDAVAMVGAAKKYGRVLGVNYNYHYMPGIKKIKEIIIQQALGRLAFINMNVHAFSYAHALDLLSFLGGRIVSISAYSKNDDSIRKFGGTDWRVYDHDILYVPSIGISVTVEFESGALGVVNSSYYYNLHAFVLSVDAVFENGAVSLKGINMFDTLGQLSYIAPGGLRKVDVNYKRGVYSKGYEYTFYESIKDFIECYVAGKPAPTSGEKGLFNMRLEKAIAESNAEHKKIHLAVHDSNLPHELKVH